MRFLAQAVVAAALLLAPGVAQAADFSVTNHADTGAGSLRQAITDANASPDPTNTITISDTGTLTLQSALPAINTSVDITGPGQNQFTVSGADHYRPLDIAVGTTVSISNLTVAHGLCDTACGSFGGGIANFGTLTLTDTTVNANTASRSGGTSPQAEGGGIYNAGTLTLTQTTVSGNTLSVTGYTNQGNPYGGGIYNAGSLTLDRSTLDSNTATATGGQETNAHGGAIQNAATLTVRRSTLSNNTASGTGASSLNGAYGGAIGNTNDPDNVHVVIARSTIGGNAAVAPSPGSPGAGGVEVYGATFSITSSTITHNTGGLYANLFASANVDLKNTIISDPIGGGTNCLGSGVSSHGYNLADDSSCNLTDPTDQPSTDPMLAASLAANGGPTETYSLQDGSPAIDKGKSSAGEAVDQRGETRPSDFGNIANASGGDGSDIGAFEVQDTDPPDTILDSGPSGPTNDPTPTFAFHSTEGGSTFQCKIDAGAYAACTSPKTLAHLADGSHTFAVRAIDLAMNFDPTPASRSYTVKTAAISRSGSALVVTAAPGAKDNIQVTKPSPSTIQVTDMPGGALYSGSGVHTVSGAGCTLSGDYTANCNAGGVTSLRVSSADLTDRVRNLTSVRSTLRGGPASDKLIGGQTNDTIDGGPGADSLGGSNGNDTLLARDQTSDAVIDCDGGAKPGTADKAILDALPMDPDAIVVNCETKVRP